MFRPFEKTDSLYYMGLVFMLFPFAGAIWLGYPLWTLPLSILFVLAYLAIIHIRDRYQTTIALLWFYLLAYVVFLSSYVTGNLIWFFFFLTNLLVWRFRDKLLSYRFLSFFAGILLSTSVSIYRNHDVASRIFFALVPLFIMAMYYTQHRSQVEESLRKELYKQNETINLLAAENERNRIGRDLHDTLGHTFAMMTLKTELALKQLDKEELTAVRKELTELHSISQTSMKEVRQLINNLKYRTVSEELSQIKDMFALSGIELIVNTTVSDEQLSPVLHSSLTMILRELTTNIIKHSEATHCQISLEKAEQIVLTVTDDGKGFAKLTGNELHSIKERLQLVDGQISILSTANPTTIQVTLTEKGAV